ncbi:hypothetical protein [Methylobacterium sp. J-070]|uniref:hypothetical protein n=1 Tax=Methylobacterium sp. J-070 TaxID=2836650 RepID=UPI001FBA61A4|nr:hypothetical protein [Methylobacterium sp. J-070]MCJ2052339.1 hypothetical protein [Methylobacterium sp. J-070]
MPYTVEITIPPAVVDNEAQAARMYQLPEPFGTVAEAHEAAVTHIEGLGLDPARVLYTVFDREGFTVASNAEQPAEAG